MTKKREKLLNQYYKAEKELLIDLQKTGNFGQECLCGNKPKTIIRTCDTGSVSFSIVIVEYCMECGGTIRRITVE